MMTLKPIFPTLLAFFLLLSACQTTPPSNVNRLKQNGQTALSPTGPYTGPASLKIDTCLMKKSRGTVIDLTPNQDNFRTQSVPVGPIVWSETFTLNQKKEQEWLRSFKVSDTSKRYIVHVAKQEPQQGKDGRVQINLNGAWVIREKDFERGEEEFQTTGLLLNANNSLKVRLKGKTGSRLTLTVVEAGEVGTILRRRGWERDKDLTQADRIRNNDTNIFDPNDPNSLGNLQPYEGDQVSETNPQIAVGETEVNGNQTQIFIGEVWVALQEPRAEKLQALLERYPVELISQDDFSGVGIAHLKLNLNQVSLNSIIQNIQILNTRENIPALINARFSSINTVKTLALLLELQVNANDLVYGVALNKVMNPHSIEPIDSFEEILPIPLEIGVQAFSPPYLASSFWWLNQNLTREAWNYSVGHGTTLAILDSNFGYIYDVDLSFPSTQYGTLIQSITGYPEFRGRLIKAPGSEDNSYLKIGTRYDLTLNFLNNQYPPPKPFKLDADPGHGLRVSQISGAGMDDNQGIAGISPYSKILPMNIGGGFDIVNSEFLLVSQLNRILRDAISVDVINISSGTRLSFWDRFLQPSNENPQYSLKGGLGNTNFGMGLAVLNKTIQNLINKNIIVVASAGNNAEITDINNEISNLNLPSSFDGVISVGAYQKDSTLLKIANFDTISGDRDIGSNYGPRIDIWAPGKNILSLERNWNLAIANPTYENKYNLYEGTSYAAPQVAGVIALMKSWNKSLNSQQALDILKSTGTPLNSFHFSGTPNPVGLNALAALQHPLVGAKQARTFNLLINSQGKLLDALGNIYETQPDYREKYPQFITTGGIPISKPVVVRGWIQADRPSIPANTIQMIDMKLRPSLEIFEKEAISDLIPPILPPGIEVFMSRNSQRVKVEPGEVIGLAVKPDINLSQLEVVVSGQTLSLQEILGEASDGFKYGSFKLPENLQPGVQDVIIRLVGTPGVTLEEALEVLLPSRVNIRMSQNILFSDGSEKAEVYITVRDAQGNIVPDGSRYFIYGAYPDGNPSYYLYDYLTQTDSCIGYYCGPYLQGFEVRNGRIRFKLGVSFFINPLLIVEPWPTINAPSFQLRVCQGSSASCDQDLGPASQAAGRFFMHHIDSISVISKTPESGGTRIEMAVKDFLGNPIPVGHVLTFENGGYSHCLIRQDGTSEGGYSRIPVTELGKIIVKWNSDDISCNRATYFNVSQGNASGYYLKGSPVFLP